MCSAALESPVKYPHMRSTSRLLRSCMLYDSASMPEGRSTRWGCNSKHWKTRSSHKCRSKLLFQVETSGLWEVKCYLTIVPLQQTPRRIVE